jgi:demethylmenaquinone methyltransferase/2-methoxy-6-polyprenyl-1,4-benzoquinol methylase
MKLFSKSAREYDFLLRILSFGRDRFWRQSVVRISGAGKKGARVLDIACGTGLLSFQFASSGAEVVGVDVTREMLERALKLDKSKVVSFVQARAESLPLRNDVFDAAVISLATRNLSSVDSSFREMSRCLGPGRRVVSMDFTRPIGKYFAPFYYFYIFNFLPAVGLLISRHWSGIFVYLANSIRRSKTPEQLADIMSREGLKDLSIRRMTRGVTALVSARKSAA